MTATLGKFGPTHGGNRPLAFYRMVRLPDGAGIFCEVAIEPEDLTRGLMFRESLGLDEGMLFVHPNLARVPIHMRNVLMPIDVLWLSPHGSIVEFARGCQPCKSDECPAYGGRVPSAFTVELAAGTVTRHNLKLGDLIAW